MKKNLFSMKVPNNLFLFYLHWYFDCIYGCVRVSDSLEQELQTVGSMWVLGIELGSSGRAEHALNHWAISPTPKNQFSKEQVQDILKYYYNIYLHNVPFIIHMWKSNDSLWELGLSCHVGSRDRSQVVKHGVNCLYLMSHLTSLKH